MAQPRPFAPVKPVCGVIYKDGALYGEVRRRLEAEWGRVDSESAPFPFDLTDHYGAEMGEGLTRRFVSFEALIAPETLPSLKIRAIELEEALRKERGAAGRPVNIDPGYLTAAALSWPRPRISPTVSRWRRASTPTSNSCSPGRASKRSSGRIPI